MASKYDVSLDALERSAHIPLKDQIELQDVSPPVPDLLDEDDRIRQQVLRNPG